MFHKKEKNEESIHKFKLKVLKILHGEDRPDEDSESYETDEDESFSAKVSNKTNVENAPQNTSFENIEQSNSFNDKGVSCPKMQKSKVTNEKQSTIPIDDTELVNSDVNEAESDCVSHHRMRKHRSSHKTQPEREHAGSSTMKPHVQNSELTRNQRRKLKKKRREKEKKDFNKPGLSAFTFEDSTHSEELVSKQRLQAAEHLAMKKAAVCEFLQAVWEVYSVDENSDKSISDTEINLKAVEEYFGRDCAEADTEVLLLHKVMSNLLLPGPCQAQQKIQEFERKSTIDQELCEFIKRILTYWSTQIMNR